LILYFTAFAAAFHIYVYWKLCSAFGSGRWSLFFLGTFASLAVISLAHYFELIGNSRFFEIIFALAITEYVIVGMICTVLVLTEVLKIILCLWDKVKKTHTEARITPRRAAIFSLTFVACVVVYGHYEAWNVRKIHVTVPSYKLPENTERLRVVQISDVHIGGIYPARHLEMVMAMVRAAEPDIFVITGDLVDGDMTYRDREAALLAAHGARYGAFAVVGNHEHHAGLDQAIDFIERSGLTLLYDEMAEAAGITIIGLDDLTTVWPFHLQVPRERFVLLLQHRQNVMPTSVGRFDLQLSGHTHGGQIWPLGFFSQYFKISLRGFQNTGRVLYM